MFDGSVRIICIRNIIMTNKRRTLLSGCSKDSPDEQAPNVEPEVVEAYEALNVSYGPD